MSTVARPQMRPIVAPIMSMGTNRPELMAEPLATEAPRKYHASIVSSEW
jgi:hypothetical protein